MNILLLLTLLLQFPSITKTIVRDIDLPNGESTQEEGYYNNNDKKQWVRHGAYKLFFENGDIKVQGNYYEGKAEGHFIYYHRGLEPHAEGDFKNGKREGYWKFYHIDGILSHEGLYEMGLKQGLHKYYATNAQIVRWINYYYGEPHGEFALWYEKENPDRNPLIYPPYYCPLGRLLWDIGKKYTDKLQQKYNAYSVEQGTPSHPAVTGWFKHGKHDRHWKAWYPDGTPRFSICYVDGLPDGEVRLWYPNSQVASIQYYVNGRKAGFWRYWYPDGKLHKEMTYDHNQLNGEYRCFYENGVRQCIGDYLKGKKVGLWRYYAKDGLEWKGKKE